MCLDCYSSPSRGPIRISDIAHLAFHKFINDTLRRASDIVNSGRVEDPELLPAPDSDGGEVAAEAKGIVTTAEEIQGYELVRAVVSDVVDPERVFIRDTKSYCGVLLDDTNRKPICRMHFNTSHKRLSVLAGERSEQGALLDTFYEIEDVNDIADTRRNCGLPLGRGTGQWGRMSRAGRSAYSSRIGVCAIVVGFWFWPDRLVEVTGCSTGKDLL